MSWWQDFSLIDCSPRKYHTCHKKIRAKPKNSIKSDFKDLLLDKKTIEVIAESSCRRWSVNSLLISANVENRPFNYLETQNDKTWFIKYLPGKENVCYDSKNFILPIFIKSDINNLESDYCYEISLERWSLLHQKDCIQPKWLGK